MVAVVMNGPLAEKHTNNLRWPTYRYWPLEGLRTKLSKLEVESLLTPVELADYRRRRHTGWLAGRMLAKQLIIDQLQIHRPAGSVVPQQVNIDSGRVGPGQHRPRISVDNEPLDWALSISHTTTAVLVALCTLRGVRIGVDLVDHQPLGRGFATTWFNKNERQMLNPTGDSRQLAAAWAVKEATYKACNQGEPFRPREIHVFVADNNQYQCAYRGVPLAAPSSVHCLRFDSHFAVIVTRCTIEPTDNRFPLPG